MSLEKYSRILVGCWRLRQWGMNSDELNGFISQSADLGLTTFDHADIYGDYSCEQEFGKAITPELRERIQLVTKCGIGLVSEARPQNYVKHYNLGKKHILASVEQSLRNLRTDHIDLLLLHRPDPLMNADEVADAFRTLQDAGKVDEFGASNFSKEEFALLNDRFPLVTNQLEISVMQTDVLFSGVLEYLQGIRVTPMAWSPFGGGRLFDEKSARARSLQRILDGIAENHRTTIDVVALAWLLKHPSGICPVIGSGKISRLKQYRKALDVHVSRQDWFAILQASRGHEIA